MSFDIHLNNGDIQLDAAGNLIKVENTDKLVQDVMKILYTTQGSDPFNPFYGSILTEENIGIAMLPSILEAKAREAIYNSLETLRQNQAQQELYQELTSAEKLVGVADLIVEQDKTEPRQYNVILTVLTEEMTPITLEFNFTI